MENILMGGTVAFFITFFAIPVIIIVAKEKKLFDEPDNRKVHKSVIPNLGGLGIFAGFMIATLLCVPKENNGLLQYFIAAATVIFFLGLKDDILILSATKKFIGQLIAAAIIMKLGGAQIQHLHGFLGIEKISEVSSVILSLFTIIVITNSFNLIDGVDGLAASLGILTSSIFGVYFFINGEQSFAVISFSLTCSLIGFLIYNFPPAKIFMGDTGSLLVGLINSILVIKFINYSNTPNIPFHIESAPAVGFAILMLPLFDTLRVFGLRILSHRSPFSPDRNHIHHIILDLGFSHRNTTLICFISNCIFIAVAIYFNSIGTTLLFGILFGMAIVFFTTIYYFRSSKRIKTLEDLNKNNSTNDYYSLVSETVEID